MESILTVETIAALVLFTLAFTVKIVELVAAAINLATSVVSFIKTFRDGSRKK